MKKKKQNKFLTAVFLFLFITYITLYISQKSGYLDFENYKRKSLTEENIKQFEKDIKEGKKVDLQSYSNYEKKDYSNKLSNIGYNSSVGISKLVATGVDNFFKTVSKLAEE